MLYVDDLNLAANKIPLRISLEKDKGGEFYLVHHPDVEEGSLEEVEPHTAQIDLEVANSILPRKVDIPSNHTNHRLPILDMEVWFDGNTIRHNHYSKPMASKAVIMERSAFTTKEKKNILMEEANRMLRNCDPNMPWEVKREHLTTLNIQMMVAGHSQQFRDW